MKMKNNFINSNAWIQSGMTLAELMISMSITLFMLAGVMGVYVNSKQVYRVQDNMSRLQENARFTLDFLAKNIRMAGYVGCQRSILENTISGDTIDLESFFYFIKYDGTNWSNEFPGTSDNVKLGSDILIIKRGEATEYPLEPMINKSDPVQISSNNHLQVNDIVLISNCSKAEIFTVENIDSLGFITHAPFRGVYGSDDDDNGYSDDNAVIIKMSEQMYYIQDKGDEKYSLRQRNMITGHDEEMVEGVENMHITTIIDNDNPNAIESVKIDLLMRSLGNGIAIDKTTDRYIRKPYSITVNRRN